MKRGAVQAYVALAFLALFWGYSWVAIKVATQDGSVIAVALGRNGCGALALLAFLVVSGRSLRPTPFFPTLVYGLLQTTAFTLLQTIAVSIGGAGKASVLAYTMPFWLAILAWPFLGERIAGARWWALGLAAVGLVLIVMPLQASSILASGLPVAAGFVWAVSVIWVSRLRASRAYDLLSLTAWQMVWGALAMVPFLLVMPVEVRWTTSFLASMAFLAVFSTAVGWALWLFILSRLPASVAGIASLATPVVGVALAALQLHEIPSLHELAGIAAIVTALVVNSRAPGARGAARSSRE